ncbi:MAG: hypothetical protein P9L92_05290 [Candidatus Electryonea clarkiae]|nr:hypothetical protein [Candidatus Electryonea clarkiae]MDP8286913.1 hypothetical protein [Candidatus Electryonea clarkiae]
MKSLKIFFVFALVLLLHSTHSFAQGGDLLNEMGFQTVPDGMTYEEYRDANRRLAPAVLMAAAIPVPGMMHFQAGEKKRGYYLLGGAFVGAVSILSGIATASEGDEYKETDYGYIDIDNVRYEKIPILVYDDNGVENKAYALKELGKESEISGAGVFLVALGGGILIADYIYDWWHGINVIQEKRDKVRYKYGKQISLGMAPIYNPENGAAGIQLGLKF